MSARGHKRTPQRAVELVHLVPEATSLPSSCVATSDINKDRNRLATKVSSRLVKVILPLADL